jgi:hypothetical protein
MDGNDSLVKMPEMHLPPEADRGIDLDALMKQVLALLTVYWGEKRVALAGSPSGVLFVSSAQLAGIWHVTDTGGNYNYRGPDRLCSEVMVMGHPSASGTIWAQVHKAATTTNAWPVAKKEVVSFTITNLNMLNLLIPTANDRAIIAYSV